MKDRNCAAIANAAMTSLLKRQDVRARAVPSLDKLRISLGVNQNSDEILTLSSEAQEGRSSPTRQFATEEVSVHRKVDLDVANTTIELSAVEQDDYASIAFGCLWNIGQKCSSDCHRVCCFVSILDQTLIANLKPEWQFYEPTCRLAFFRGQPNDYFADLSEVVGAVAILRLDYIVSFSEFDAFVESLRQLTTATR